MYPILSYITYFTIVCLVLNFISGKLKLLSLVWLYHLQKPQDEPTMGMSVIICTHNDLEALQHNLPPILTQDYHPLEVIVVNDASTDATQDYLEQMAAVNQHLRVLHLPVKTSPGKKQALQQGIQQARYPFVLLTDADCAPLTQQWVKSQARMAADKNRVVLGYGKYRQQPGFLNTLIRFDTATIAIQYMSKALWGYAYMGVGRNLGYSKDLSTALGHIHAGLASGDDDLFIQAITQKASFVVNIEKESFTSSNPKTSWQAWFTQKGRHTTTAPAYSLFTQAWLMLQWFTQLGFYTGIIILLSTGSIVNGLMLFMLNALSIALFNGLWLSKLGEKDLILLSPFLNFIYTFVQPIFVIKSWGRKKDQWN
jgi:glycosyltransferase involved in cell wall biosynthesis